MASGTRSKIKTVNQFNDELFFTLFVRFIFLITRNARLLVRLFGLLSMR